MRLSRSLAALALAVAVLPLGTAAANAAAGANAPGAHVRSASTYVAQFDAQPIISTHDQHER